MADVYGVNATVAFNTTPAGQVLGNEYGGAVKCLDDTYEAAAAAAGTDVIVGRLKAGSRILPESKVFCDDLGTGVTLEIVTRLVSDGSTETSVVAATDVASDAAIVAPTIDDIDTIGVELAADSDIVLKIAGGTATGTIKSFIRYV